jgi:holo-[acyl-carrier protein] synthase
MHDLFDIGIDIVPISKIDDLVSNYGECITSVYTEREIAYCRGKKNAGEFFAARFAAKEAVLKALGLGLGKGVAWTDVETISTNSGKPRVYLHGKVEETARKRRIAGVKISLSHCRQFAVAQALVERES